MGEGAKSDDSLLARSFGSGRHTCGYWSLLATQSRRLAKQMFSWTSPPPRYLKGSCARRDLDETAQGLSGPA